MKDQQGRPDIEALFATASEQMGYFTAAQARDAGYYPRLLQHHANTGRFQRVRRGLYRLRDYPTSPREEVMSAWIAVGKERAVVSHESALDLHELSDIIPDSIHLTVDRTSHRLPGLPGVTVHTTSLPMRAGDVVIREGMRVTSPVRTLLDSTQAGAEPAQIELAIRQAVERGLITRQQLEAAAAHRSRRVRGVVFPALDLTAA